MNTLIIRPEDISTKFLKTIYAPILHKTVITGGVNKFQLIQLIKNHERIIMLGHGSPYGLLSVGKFPNVGSYIIDSSFSNLLLTGSNNIYIWCYANYFVSQFRLAGFNSGMFISELNEAFKLGLYDADLYLINESNECFANIVSRNIHQPLHNFYENVLQEYSRVAEYNPIAQYNLERLYINSN